MQPLAYIMVPMYRISKLILISVLIACQLNAGNFGQMNFAYWQSPVSGVVASGGTATSGNGYNQWSFTTTGSSTFTVSTGGTVYYAIVAGGGGGGWGFGGGAGGGGVVVGQTTLTAGTYTIVVGTGGAGGTSSNGYAGLNGSNSTAFGFTAVGGGGGGSNYTSGSIHNGLFGGSGGGAASDGSNVDSYGVGVAGQGWSGGSNGTSSSPYPAGGGGGAGGIGITGSGSTSGNGGTGLGVYLPVSASTVYYGGGGGGSGNSFGSSAGSGGTGGGGTGGTTGAGGAGSANTGGGGGGGGYNSGTNYAGGNGGSGIVVIWSPIATPAKTPYVQYLAVAGGGGSAGSNTGVSNGAGGGAGGVLQGLAQVTGGTTYTITVGSGGSGGATSSNGTSGGNSSISGSGLTTITAIGGGYGAYGTSTGGSGGSGGGGGPQGSGYAGGSATTGQGYNGGVAGGGGGYGMAGTSIPGVSNLLNGGDGFTTYIANPATYSWSNHFNGSTDNFTVPTSFSISSGTAYTIECWVFITSYSSNGFMFGESTNGMNFNINSGGTVSLSKAGIGYVFNGVGSVPLNTWTHIAAARNTSNSARLWINGVSIATATDSYSYTNTTTYVGSATSGSYLNGYISNLRLVNGTDVYGVGNSTITVPTTPLTNVTNTQLLTCQSPTFSDSSSNNYTLTINGSPFIASQNPFGASYAGGGAGDYTGVFSYGGMGGGGNNGTSSTSPVAGGTNTGGGGGGSNANSTPQAGVAGGSGIVILAYPSTYPAATSVTGSPTVTTSGGFRVYTFTGTGSITF